MKTIASISFAAVLSFAVAPPVAADGIFADIQTSLGAFSAELHYATAPQTVANFISLAEGTRAWVDPTTGAVRNGKRFYDGLIFHRVIKDFMNQGGCPLGTGTSGPGYQFRDELAGGLLHDVPYRLSMANSGRNTNGSQFFVTAVPTPHLDGKHTVFGTVTQGQAVVNAINSVPTSGSPNDRPLTPVVIQSVTIRREGAAAETFDVHAQGLPECAGSRGRLEVRRDVAARWLLDSPMPIGDMVLAYHSPDLKDWTRLKDSYGDPALPLATEVALDNATRPRAFYHLARVRYPSPVGTFVMANRTLMVQVVDDEQLFLRFDSTGEAGNAEYLTPEGSSAFPFTVYSLETKPYKTSWIITSDAINPLKIDCAINSETSTHYAGPRTLEQYGWLGWQVINLTHSFTLTK